MEIISSKQEEGFKATTFAINILKLYTNPKVLIQGFEWNFENLIPTVLEIIYPFYFDYISMPKYLLKDVFFCQNPMYNCGVISVES